MFFLNGGRGIVLQALLFVLSLCIPVLNVVAGEPAANHLFGHIYKGVQPVGEDQAQVIYYRLGGKPLKSVANIYLDQEFVTALKPGGFTTFCLRPGSHTMGAYLDDAPSYVGKSQELYTTTLKGGKTYYLKVREEGGNVPLPIGKQQAESELKNIRLQTHLLSRISKVENCRHYSFLDKPAVISKAYVLSADQLFVANNRRSVISEEGHKAVFAILQDLQDNNAHILRISIEGHTDPLGSEAHNQLLGQQWAEAVSKSLIDQGAPQALLITGSSGSRALLTSSCYGTRYQQIACYAPNRRVTVTVEVRESRAH